jgi:hypothetical protein
VRTRRLSYGRGTGPYIRARSGAAKTIRRVGEARGQIRVGTGSRPRASRTAVVAFGWAKSGLSAYSPGRCRREVGRRTDVSICHAIKHGITHSPDPGQPRVQGSGLRMGPAGGPVSTRSI